MDELKRTRIQYPPRFTGKRRFAAAATGVFFLLIVFFWAINTNGFRRVPAERIGPFDRRPESPALFNAIDHGDYKTVKRLLSDGTSPDCVTGKGDWDTGGQVALDAASGDLRITRLLLDSGADVNGENLWGRTALVTASEGGELEIVKLLVSRGADVNAEDDGETALGAAQYGESTARNSAERLQYLKIASILWRDGARSDDWLPWPF